MENYQKIVLVIGLVISFALLLFKPYFAYMGFITVAVLLMIFIMMNLSRRFRKSPQLIAILGEDAKRVTIKNNGEETAVKVHVALVPLNIEFDVPNLAGEEAYEFALPQMISEAKALITFESPDGREFSHSSPLSAMGNTEEDLLKPIFPMFRWK
jgi:hypothetical protein